MTYDNVLAALGDSTRRRVLERLRGGPLSVGEIARDLPVSRPAVSQHLRVLREAGLVAERGQGTRRFYTIAIEGVSVARDYLDTLTSGEPAKPAVRRGRRTAASETGNAVQAPATEIVSGPDATAAAPEHAKGKDGRAKAGKSGKAPKAARAAEKPPKAEKPSRTDKSAPAAAKPAREEREAQPDRPGKSDKPGKGGKAGKAGKGGKGGGKSRNADR